MNQTFQNGFQYGVAKDFLFFSPVFNIADASITTGVISIFVFQGKFFKKNKAEAAAPKEAAEENKTEIETATTSS